MSVISSGLNKYITDKKELLIDHINNMKMSTAHKTYKRDDIKLIKEVFSVLDDTINRNTTDYMLSLKELSIFRFSRVFSYLLIFFTSRYPTHFFKYFIHTNFVKPNLRVL